MIACESDCCVIMWKVVVAEKDNTSHSGTMSRSEQPSHCHPNYASQITEAGMATNLEVSVENSNEAWASRVFSWLNSSWGNLTIHGSGWSSATVVCNAQQRQQRLACPLLDVVLAWYPRSSSVTTTFDWSLQYGFQQPNYLLEKVTW